MNSRWLSALIVGLLVANGSALAELEVGIQVRLPPAKLPTWSGMPDQEPTGESGQFLYPASNAAGLLAAILTHSAIVNGARESEAKRRAELAARTLDPLRPVIGQDLESPALLAQAREQLLGRLKSHEPPAWIEVTPRYSVLSDHRAIVLDAEIHRAPTPTTQSFKGVIRVISAPVADHDATAFWLAAGGAALREEAVRMLTHALEISVLHTSATRTEAPARTHRYSFGSGTRMERGQMIQQGCDRTLLFTLREQWMSVPSEASVSLACQRAYHLGTD